MNISFDLIDESPLNPRKKFDETALDELAGSIREQGVLQPLTVRPAGDRYELVIGARRLRASKLAGLDEVPVTVRELADDQVLEIMLVENDQRCPVSPIEEADAIGRLHREFHRNPDAIADRLGRSVDYVRRRLKLVDLIAPLRELLDEERIGLGSAELLASLPFGLQEELAASDLSVDTADWHGEPVSWSASLVRQYIEKASRQLNRAPWELSADMAPHPCSECQMRSGAQLDLVDVWTDDEDRCLDAACWSSKMTAWVELQRDAGVEVLEGEDAQKAAERYGRTTSIRPADYAEWIDGERREWGELAPNAPRVIAMTAGGPVLCVRKDNIVAELRNEGDTELAEVMSGDKRRREAKENKEKATKEREVRRAKMASVVEAAHQAFCISRSGKWPRVIFAGLITEMNQDRLREVCQRRGIECPDREFGGKDLIAGLRTYAEGLTNNELYALIVELAVTGPSISWSETGKAAWSSACSLAVGEERVA